MKNYTVEEIREILESKEKKFYGSHITINEVYIAYTKYETNKEQTKLLFYKDGEIITIIDIKYIKKIY